MSELFRAFRFKVEIDGVLAAAFSQVSGFGVRVETSEYRSGNDLRSVPMEIPTLTRYDHITLSKGIVGDYDMLQWVLSVASSDIAPPTGIDRRNVTITLIDDKGKDGPKWFITGAYPVSYQISDFDALRGEVAVESLEISHLGFKRVAPEPQP